MIILPLGLGRRIPRFPILTVVIASVTAVISIASFRELKLIEKSSVDLRRETKIGDTWAHMGIELCGAEGLSSRQCALVSKLLDVYKRQLEGDLSTKEVRERVEGVFATYKSQGALSDREVRREEAVISRFLKGFMKVLEGQDEKVKSLGSYQAYLQSKEDFAVRMTNEYRGASILAKGSVTPMSVMKAQFIHGSWMHLLGNLLFFLVFSIYVENRLRRTEYLTIYFFGGATALLVEALLMAPKGICVLGASANISAIMGTFFVLFFRRDMKIFVSLLIYNRSFSCPTWLLFPVMFIIGDLTGVLRGSSGVAHLAHLSGLVFGCAAGYLLSKLEPLDPILIYPHEAELKSLLLVQRDPEKRLAIATQMLSYNHENYYAVHEVLQKLSVERSGEPSVEPSGEPFTETKALDEKSQQFFKSYFASFVNVGIRHNRLGDIDSVLSALPMNWKLSEFMHGISQVHLLSLAKRQSHNKNWLCALRLQDCYLTAYPHSVKAILVKKAAETTLDQALKDIAAQPASQQQPAMDKLITECESYLNLHPQSRLRSCIQKVVFKVTSEGSGHVRAA